MIPLTSLGHWSPASTGGPFDLARTVEFDFFGVQVRRPLSTQAGHIPNHFELGYGLLRPADLPAPGVGWAAIKDGNWSVLDDLVALCINNGLVLHYEIGGGFGGVVPDLTEWTNVYTAFATRFSTQIANGDVVLGMGNEWDGGDGVDGTFWPGDKPTGFTYQIAAVDAVRAVVPSVKVVSNSTTAPGAAYLDDFLTANGPGYFDAVGFHPYVQPGEPERMLGLSLQYRAVMEEHGISHYPLHMTECGWHAWYDDGEQQNNQWTTDPGDIQLPDGMAADYIVRCYLVALLARARTYIHWGPDEFSFSQLDLLNRSNTALLDPAGIAFAFMTTTLIGADLGLSRSAGLMFIEFVKDGQRGRVYWRRDGESSVEDLSSWSTGADVYGDPIVLSSTYTVTSSPIYVFD